MSSAHLNLAVFLRKAKIAALGIRVKKGPIIDKLNSTLNQKTTLEQTVAGVQKIGGTLMDIVAKNQEEKRKADKAAEAAKKPKK